MSFLVDTNTLSEINKIKPDAGVLAWFAEADDASLFYSVLVLAELRRGAQKLAPGAQRRRVEAFVDRVPRYYGARLLPVDLHVAERWVEVKQAHTAAGLDVGGFDELIAATAITHDLTVVTRNVRDFERSGCKLLSPWSG